MIYPSNFQQILTETLAAYILTGATLLVVVAFVALVAHGVGYRQGRASTQHRDKRGRYCK